MSKPKDPNRKRGHIATKKPKEHIEEIDDVEL